MGSESARQTAGERQLLPLPSVDVVISRCKSPLQWLWEFEYPFKTRVIVYEKCAKAGNAADAKTFEEQTAGFFAPHRVAEVEQYFLQEEGDAAGDGERGVG